MKNAKILRIALIGNPNCGKTTVFNALTGLRQKVGNWPGVTVDKKSGRLKLPSGQKAEIIDLPGIYSLEQDSYSIDEIISRDFLRTGDIDVILNVVDANNLDRQLLLTHQLRSFGIPMLIAVNKMDVAEANGIVIDTEQLARQSGVPVIGMSAIQTEDVKNLREHLHYAFRCHQEMAELPRDANDRLLARLAVVKDWAKSTTRHKHSRPSLTSKIDKVVLHPFWGGLIFLATMYLVFTFAISLGSVFIDFFDILVGAWLVDGLAIKLQAMNSPELLTVLLTSGLGGGLQLVATFIPVIGFLYIGLSVLESSGYIVRAAYVVDRIMQLIGLPGKAFVPLIVGFGCNVPAVMATRTLSRQEDRMVTVAMSPFISCGARLTVYALFAAVFFAENGQNVVFGLYLLGILMAVITGWLFRKSFYKGAISSSIMELPPYHLPSLRNVLLNSWHRMTGFIRRAGKTIIAVVMVLSMLNTVGTDGSIGNEGTDKSLLSQFAQMVTPLLAPMGVEQDNWPATVGIITGIFAKEAVVGTLDTLYSQNELSMNGERSFSASVATAEAFHSIAANFLELGGALTDPLGIRINQYDDLEMAADEQGVSAATMSVMVTMFGTGFAAFCYLVFVLLYTPCVATMGAMVREVGGRWSWIVISWSTVLAYAVATIIYQAGTFQQHVASSSFWIIGMLTMLVVTMQINKRLLKDKLNYGEVIPTTTLS